MRLSDRARGGTRRAGTHSGFRHGAVVTCSLLLLSSPALGAWEQLTSGTRAELLAVHFPTGTQVGYAVGTDTTGFGTILKTTDGGNTWLRESCGMKNGVYDVYFRNDSTGYAVSGGSLLRTTDGGTTWNWRALPGMQRLNTVQFPENGPVGYMAVTPQGGGARLLKTTNGGDTWKTIPVGNPGNTSLGAEFANDTIGVVFGYSNFIIGTTDGFDSIQHYQGAQTNGDLLAVSFSPEDSNRGYLVGTASTGGVVRFTSDGGATVWQIVRCSTVSACYGVEVPTSNVAFICGAEGFIGRTVSDTDVWATTVPEGLNARMHGLCFPNGPDTGYAVGSDGTILRTYDGGIPLIPGVGERCAPQAVRPGPRFVSSPSRRGIAFRSDVEANVLVYDALGRVVARQTAVRGLNFLPLSKAGVYIVKAATRDHAGIQKVVVER